MSHTDKTRPLWVQFRDPANRRFMKEKHDHTGGVCDFDTWLADTDCRQVRSTEYRCRLRHNYYGAWHHEFWPRPPKGCWDRGGKHGVLRMRWRGSQAKLRRAVDPGDVDDVYGPRRREYRRWQWNSWG